MEYDRNNLACLESRPWRSTGGGLPLAQTLRGKLERLMQVDLGRVRVFSHDSASALGGAFAFGNDICLSPDAPCLPATSLASILAHECAHVVQQRSGRAISTGGAVVTDRLLEREADQVALAATGRSNDTRLILSATGVTDFVAQPVFQFWGESEIIKSELEKFKSDLLVSESIYKDLEKIADLLENEESVKQALRKLNMEVKIQYFKAISAKGLSVKKGKIYGALKEVLATLEQKNSMSVVEGLHESKHITPLLVGFVPSEAFRKNLLEKGYHWKDPGAGADHGEYTHRIQWNIIMRCLKGNNNSFLNIFASTAASRKFSEYDNKELTIWDVLVDRFTPGQVEQDVPRASSAAAPNFLHTYIKDAGPNGNWSFLSDYTAKRFEKRSDGLFGFMFSKEGMEHTEKLQSNGDLTDQQIQRDLASEYWKRKFADKYFDGDIEALKKAVGGDNIFFRHK